MKPANKHQHKVFELALKLAKLSDTQKAWARKNCLNHMAYRTKTNTSCMDCGNIWKEAQTVKTCACPKCGTKLKIEDTRHKTFAQRRFVALIDVVEEYQLTRIFEIRSYHKAGQAVKSDIVEVVQHWHNPTGKKQFELIARNRAINWTGDHFHGFLEIRSTKYDMQNKYDVLPCYYFPKMNVLPIYKRNGFTGDFKGLTPYELFSHIATYTQAETLLKGNQIKFLDAFVGHKKEALLSFWHSVKIAIRNNYEPKDIGIWLDHLDTLRYLGDDTYSPKNVCPMDLDKAHNASMARQRNVIRRLEREKRIAMIDKWGGLK